MISRNFRSFSFFRNGSLKVNSCSPTTSLSKLNGTRRESSEIWSWLRHWSGYYDYRKLMSCDLENWVGNQQTLKGGERPSIVTLWITRFFYQAIIAALMTTSSILVFTRTILHTCSWQIRELLRLNNPGSPGEFNKFQCTPVLFIQITTSLLCSGKLTSVFPHWKSSKHNKFIEIALYGWFTIWERKLSKIASITSKSRAQIQTVLSF